MVNRAVLGQCLNMVLLEGFSKMNNSVMILAWQEAEPWQPQVPSLQLEEPGLDVQRQPEGSNAELMDLPNAAPPAPTTP